MNLGLRQVSYYGLFLVHNLLITSCGSKQDTSIHSKLKSQEASTSNQSVGEIGSFSLSIPLGPEELNSILKVSLESIGVTPPQNYTRKFEGIDARRAYVEGIKPGDYKVSVLLINLAKPELAEKGSTSITVKSGKTTVADLSISREEDTSTGAVAIVVRRDSPQVFAPAVPILVPTPPVTTSVTKPGSAPAAPILAPTPPVTTPGSVPAGPILAPTPPVKKPVSAPAVPILAPNPPVTTLNLPSPCPKDPTRASTLPAVLGGVGVLGTVIDGTNSTGGVIAGAAGILAQTFGPKPQQPQVSVTNCP